MWASRPHSYRGQWLKQATQKQGPVASQMQRPVVAIETFPLMLRHLQQTSVDDEPKKSPLQYAAGFVEIGSEVSPRLSDGE